MPDIDELVREYHDWYWERSGCDGGYVNCRMAQLIRDVITDERERAARIAETLRSPLVGSDTGIALVPSPREIAAAIRNGGA